jgi:hypothetical protein
MKYGESEKMNGSIISFPAAVEIQGDQVLKFIAMDQQKAEFDLIGLTDPKIHIEDSRPNVRETMLTILDNGKVELLTDEFNKPARVTILPVENGRITLRLDETNDSNPRHMLWMAAGIEPEIPIYDYMNLEINPVANNKIALFSIFRRHGSH